VIGRDGALPWHFPEDLRHFKAVTIGHAVLMGHRTYLSIGRPLPRRRNIVLSRDPALRLEGVEVAHSLTEAIGLARQSDPEPRIIGGAALYALALPLATHLYLTEVDGEYGGDTFFPSFDRTQWVERARRPGATPELTFVELVRKDVASGPSRPAQGLS
jgi:dihydrofolate reductase